MKRVIKGLKKSIGKFTMDEALKTIAFFVVLFGAMCFDSNIKASLTIIAAGFIVFAVAVIVEKIQDACYNAYILGYEKGLEDKSPKRIA